MQKLNELARRRTTVLSWAGLAAMGVQFGFLARLTWWDYSWDIMEPVTYFVTYGTTMAMFAYFVLTKQVITGVTSWYEPALVSLEQIYTSCPT